MVGYYYSRMLRVRYVVRVRFRQEKEVRIYVNYYRTVKKTPSVTFRGRWFLMYSFGLIGSIFVIFRYNFRFTFVRRRSVYRIYIQGVSQYGVFASVEFTYRFVDGIHESEGVFILCDY